MTNNPIVTAITNYVEEHRSELLSKAMLDGKSRRAFNLMTDVKGPTTLNIMDTNVVLVNSNADGLRAAQQNFHRENLFQKICL